MLKKISVIIGLGSIGIRHANILSKYNFSLHILSKNRMHNFKILSKIDDILEINPDYIVISNLTYKHAEILKFIDTKFKGKKCFIEKPLFSVFNKNLPKLKNNNYYIGYVMRYHPFYFKVKKIIKSNLKNIFHIEFNSSSYLPDWRSNLNYKLSSSALKKSGGVIHDYSHEIDFIFSLLGQFKINYVKHKKISNLKIKSKDYLNINGNHKNKVNIDIRLNYFSRKPYRELKIFLNNKSYTFDFINSNIVIQSNKKIIHKKINLKKDELYMKQHIDILKNKPKIACTYNQALKLHKFLSSINNYEN